MTRTTLISGMTMACGTCLALAGPNAQQAGVAGREGHRPMAVVQNAGTPSTGEHFTTARFTDRMVFDEAAELPPHPPIDQIPFMPMGEPGEGVRQHQTMSGGVTLHDATTGQTVQIPGGQASGLIGGESIEGEYMGLAPYDPMIELARTFGTMTVAGGLDTWPRSGNCKVIMRFTDINGNFRWFQCSGTMADAGVVLTAAHCVFNRAADINDWADVIYVYPGWDGNGNPWGPAADGVFQNFGWAEGTSYIAGSDYVNNGNWDRDCALIRINRGGSRNIGMLTGWFGWAWGGGCGDIQSRTYNNFSYPAENCGGGLHTGTTMYYWSGAVDSCPGNQMELSTNGNCLDTVWGGMSGSGMYYISGDSRYVHSVCSTSNRNDVGRYCKLWEQFVLDMEVFENDTRSNAQDWEPLAFRAGGATTVQAGTNMNADCTVQMCNATNADPGVQDYTLRVYLSSNNNISSTDTLLATWIWGSRDFGAMNTVNFQVPAPYIPIDTPPGTYWIGVIADSAIPGTDANDDTDTWDAQQITVTVGLPAVAATPIPGNGSTGVDNAANLDWGTAARATSYQVYFGTDSTPDAGEYLGSTFSSAWTLPNLAYSTTYYWRVDTVNSAGTTTGPTWSFTTEPQPMPDLVAELADAPGGTYVRGENVNIIHRTRNSGTLNSTGYSVQFRLSTNNIISAGDALMDTRNYGALNIGASFQTSTSVQIPPTTAPGTYFVGTIIADNGGLDLNNGNNSIPDVNTITVVSCLPDFAAPYGTLNFFDVSAFLSAYNNQQALADIAAPFGTWNFFDVSAFLSAYNAGCP